MALLHRLGVLGLFDFTAAFPSISREFILRVLAAARFPQWAVDVADAPWQGAEIVLSDGTVAYPLDAGVGQGCPAAAVLFVAGIDPLLVALQKQLDTGAGETLSAYADDIALVVTESFKLAKIHEEFELFKRASALSLNMYA